MKGTLIFRLAPEKPGFSTENPGLQRKTRFFLRKTRIFWEKPGFSGEKPVFSEKLGFSAVKQGFLAQTLLFCHSMKTQVFNRKPRFSTDNPGFQQKTQVFRQKNPACRPLPIRLAIHSLTLIFWLNLCITISIPTKLKKSPGTNRPRNVGNKKGLCGEERRQGFAIQKGKGNLVDRSLMN